MLIVENGLVVAWVGRRVDGLDGCVSCLPPVCSHPDAKRCGGMPNDAEGCETAHRAENHRQRRGRGNRWGKPVEEKGRLEAAESIERAKLEFQLVEFARKSSTDGKRKGTNMRKTQAENTRGKRK